MSNEEIEATRILFRASKVLGWVAAFILIGLLAFYLPLGYFIISIGLVLGVGIFNYFEGMAKSELDTFG